MLNGGDNVPTITATLKMFDAMTKPIQNITNSMNLMLRAMDDMQNAAERNLNIDRTLTAAKSQLAAAEAEIRRSIDQATQAQQRFDQSVRESKSSTDGLASSVKRWAAGLAAAYLSFQGIRSAIQATDTFVSTQARLDLIVDDGQSVEELSNIIFAASQRARGDFVAMADNVSRLGLLAGEAFESTAEMVAFTAIMQKAFKVSGAGIQEQTAAMYQLSQAMAAGRLQGDEFVSIMENAPMVADAIARYMGVSKGELKEMSAEGLITADIIKGALFAAADDINKKFKSMPKTFGDVSQQFKNKAFQALQPVFQRLNQWLNSVQGEAIVQKLTMALYVAAQAADVLLGTIIWITNAIQSNWSIIEPILVAIGSALSFWALRQIPLLTVKLWLMVQPILAAAASWALANLPILLIGAAIGFLIYVLYRWKDVTTEVIGYVGGIFGVLFGFLYNGFSYFANILLSVAEFLINVWKDPVYAVKKLFYDLVINALKWLENLAKGIENIINKIPGLEVNMTEGLSNLINRLENARDNLKTEADVVNLMRFEQKGYKDAFKFGQRIGQSIERFAADGVQKAFDAVSGRFDVPTLDNTLRIAELGNINKVNEVGKIRDTVDISSEDLKVMREFAEMKSIQNFVTLTPTVQVTTGPINKDVDVDTVIARIEESLTEQIASSAKGLLR